MTETQGAFYAQHVMGEHDATPPVIHRAQARLARKVPPRPSTRRLLDIGSGAGVGATLLANSIGIDHVVCIDISLAALKETRRRGLSPLIASAEGFKLPFPDAVFDVVVLDEVIEHLVDTDSIIDEIHRVLRTDGQLLLSTPNLAAWFNRVALLFGLQPAFSEVSFKKVYGRPGSGLVGHLRLFTKRALLAFTNDKGFAVRHVTGVPFPELPRLIQPFDRLLSRISAISGGLVLVADKVS